MLSKALRKTAEKPQNQAGIDAFAEFWSAYPSRGNASNPKHPALAKFLNAVKAGTPALEIIHGARGYAQAIKTMNTEPEFVKQATTWLNQRCWEQYQVPIVVPKPRPQASDWQHTMNFAK